MPCLVFRFHRDLVTSVRFQKDFCRRSGFCLCPPGNLPACKRPFRTFLFCLCHSLRKYILIPCHAADCYRLTGDHIVVDSLDHCFRRFSVDQKLTLLPGHISRMIHCPHFHTHRLPVLRKERHGKCRFCLTGLPQNLPVGAAPDPCHPASCRPVLRLYQERNFSFVPVIKSLRRLHADNRRFPVDLKRLLEAEFFQFLSVFIRHPHFQPVFPFAEMLLPKLCHFAGMLQCLLEDPSCMIRQPAQCFSGFTDMADLDDRTGNIISVLAIRLGDHDLIFPDLRFFFRFFLSGLFSL